MQIDCEVIEHIQSGQCIDLCMPNKHPRVMLCEHAVVFNVFGKPFRFFPPKLVAGFFVTDFQDIQRIFLNYD